MKDQQALYKLWQRELQWRCVQSEKERGINYSNNKSYHLESKNSKDWIIYACHTCGMNRHKMTNYPKLVQMQKMFQVKNASTLDGKLDVDVKQSQQK